MRGCKVLIVSLAILTVWVSTGCASARRDWAAARTVDEVQAYEWFLKHHSESEHAPEAQHRLELLRRDLPAWEQATAAGTVGAYERFTAQHSDSPYAERARNIIVEWRQDESGRDIVNALAQGKVQVEATGSGRFLLVNLRIRRTIDRPLRVVVPAGTFFACRGLAQNMIALADGVVDLRDGEWRILQVVTACVDLMKSVPQPGDTFSVQRSANQKDLRKLMEVLRPGAAPLEVQPRDAEQALKVLQAAIWIVAGDANYAALRILTRNPSGGPPRIGDPRAIDETDAAMAMKLVDHAGIHITRKAIWTDRWMIAPAVSDPSLKTWVERR
jgi:hypothetical protein